MSPRLLLPLALGCLVGCGSPADPGPRDGLLQLAVVSGPRSALSGTVLGPITVELRRNGRRELEEIPVTVRIPERPGALAGTTTATTTAGVVTFTDLRIEERGGFALRFTAEGAADATHEVGIVVEPPVAASLGPWVIAGVTVLPMTGEPLPDHTVVVVDGRIAALGPDGQVPIPSGATAIEGTGRWLTPGLIDFHTHERGFPAWPDDVPGNFVMYLANGVTTIVNMGDFTGGLLPYRGAVRTGSLPGPTPYLSQIVRGRADGGFPIVETVADAEQVVQKAKAEGYDFLKLYNAVPVSVFDGLVAAARGAGLAVTGHASSVGLRYAITHGQVMVAHTGEFLPLVAGGSAADRAVLAAEVAASGAAVTPTIHVVDVIRQFGLDAIAGRDLNVRLSNTPGAEYMDDAALTAWRSVLQQRADIRTPTDRSGQVTAVAQLTLAFQRAGVRLLLGSDNIGIPAVIPGFSVPAELEQLRAAGLSGPEVLAVGTRNGGEFINQYFGVTEPLGIVAVGARADLVLHAVDPRADLSSFRSPEGVMAAGRWYQRAWLHDQLERLRYTR